MRLVPAQASRSGAVQRLEDGLHFEIAPNLFAGQHFVLSKSKHRYVKGMLSHALVTRKQELAVTLRQLRPPGCAGCAGL